MFEVRVYTEEDIPLCALISIILGMNNGFAKESIVNYLLLSSIINAFIQVQRQVNNLVFHD